MRGEQGFDSECILKGKILKFVHRLAGAHERKAIRTLKSSRAWDLPVVRWVGILPASEGDMGPIPGPGSSHMWCKK